MHVKQDGFSTNIVLLQYSPRVGGRVEQEDVQIQQAMVKFYAKMHAGKGSTIGMLAEVYSCYWLWFDHSNNYIQSSYTIC